jgi:4-amino-4-deoxy-L-arabinose transferase-like glycosyltransferase
MNLYLLTIAMAAAMLLPPLVDKGQRRERIGLDIQLTLLAIVLVYAAAMAVVGGAVLARYMLPVVPLIIVVWVSTLWRRVRRWHLVVGVIALAFAAGWFQNPPYGFAPEDNLAYRDYIELHERAAQFLLTHSPETRVLTAWPGRDELSRPYLGYVDRPIKVIAIEDFSLEQVMGAADFRSNFDTVFAFSTKVEPLHPMFENWTQWQEWKKEYFGYHRDLPPAAIAQMLGGKLIYQEERNGQWVGVIEMEQLYEARR